MRIALSDSRRRILFFCAVFLIGAAELYASGRLSLAAAWSASSNPLRWEAAARLEPQNAAYWERLGLHRQWDLQNRDLEAATDDLKRAVRIDPLSAEYQLNLASIEESRRDLANARKAFEAARNDYPLSAEVAWRYGNFLLRQGDSRAGFSEIRHAITNDPDLETTALSECSESNPDAKVIINQALPETTRAYLTSIDYFVSQGQTYAALVSWSRLLGLGQSFPMSRSLPLVDKLIGEDRVEDAKRVWSQALLATGWARDPAPSGSLIFDGGFEETLLEGGFDWRNLQDEDYTLTFDSKIVHSGKRALRIKFSDQSNLNFEHLFQIVAVHPGQRYRFSAFLRTENITSDSGIRIQIVDPHHPEELQVLTPSLTGNNSWIQTETTLQIPPTTDLLEVILRRLPSAKLDNKLGGTVWLDDVSLTLISTESQRELK